MPHDLNPPPVPEIAALTPAPDPAARTHEQLSKLDALLGHLNPPDGATSGGNLENQLVAVRLGVASSLFTALRVKHGPTADHSLRVANSCSSWSVALGLPKSLQDELEVVALLHDIGKIGIPDAILRKPSALTPDQTAEVNRAQALGLKILAHSVSDHLLRTISHVRAWYDGSRSEFVLRGAKIPLAARMVHIVDVYDTMTTGTIYRRAVSKEVAIAELFRAAGTQFDPELVQGFADVEALGQLDVLQETEPGWLSALTADRSDALWRLRLPDEATRLSADEATWYLEELSDGLPDAIMFLDASANIIRWSRGAEKLTGIPATATEQRLWLPSLLTLRDKAGQVISDEQCPLLEAVRTGFRVFPRMLVRRRNGEHLPVDIHVFPVARPAGVVRGAIVVFRDASSQSDLEDRVRCLHERATTDPLTGLSNRAEFDRAHVEAVRLHLTQNAPCSLIICDIDRFKSINDKYGHQAGDEALVSFANILRRSCRSGDLVARYGGEEFVVICEQCDVNEATQLAEKVRRELSRTPLKELGGQCITASFGVTELQPGDSVETMLRRADRGLLRAKDTGRNRVVQLGTGMQATEVVACATSWWSWMRPRASHHLTECFLHTIVPLQVAIEKLRGFIADHEAEVLRINGHAVSLRITCNRFLQQRRENDRSVPFVLDLDLSERQEPAGPPSVVAGGTIIQVRVQAVRDRDRRSNPVEAARQLVNSLKSYLMAQEITGLAKSE